MDNHYCLRHKIITGKIILSWSISYYISICMLHRRNIHWTRCIGQSYSEISVYCDPEQYGRKYLRKPKLHFSILPSSFSPFRFARSYILPSRSATQPYSERQVLLPISQRDVGSIPDRRTEITELAKANVRRPFSGLIRGWLPTGTRIGDKGW